MLLGVDTGGTFTDFVLVREGRVALHKVLSTPEAPERAILTGIAELGLDEAARRGELRIVHGSTVATNAALEGKGVRTVYVADAGLADILTLGRQNRRDLYDLTPAPAAAPVSPELCLEVPARLGAEGEVVTPLTATDLDALVTRVRALAPEAVAVNLLYGWKNDAHERRVEQALLDALGEQVFVCRSSFVLPEYREYERGIATWLNAWLGPRVAGYLERLAAGVAPSTVAIMQSSGGTMEAGVASRRAVNLLLSGPAGGIAGAAHAAKAAATDRLLTFDMGGTSTDVALIQGEPSLTREARLGPWPVAVPMLDIHTIGAGGGSIARVDAGGALQVGPVSAGADPGPACYGRGGTEPTVTDAHVVLGHLPATATLGGSLALDATAAREAVARLADRLGTSVTAAARGILEIADEHMAQALRVMSVERGRDPRDHVLCCFGGAGGLHLCALAERLGIRRALIPVHAGVLSALGMLVAQPERQLSRTLARRLDTIESPEIEAAFRALEREATDELVREGHDPATFTAETWVDLRYAGQAHTLDLPWHGQAFEHLTAAFHERHRERYGHALGTPVELVNVRLRLRAGERELTLPRRPGGGPATAMAEVPVEGLEEPVPVYRRDELGPDRALTGPALVLEPTSTSWIAVGWVARSDAVGNLVMERSKG